MQQHWEQIYAAKRPEEVSWYREHLETSLELVERACDGRRDAVIVDAGGGAATLVDDLAARGYTGVVVVDLAGSALASAQARLGEKANTVKWVCGDVCAVELAAGSVDVWHDRAVFHFLTEPVQRAAYVRQVARVMRPGGKVIVSTFGPEGPEKCSGLPVSRYGAGELHGEFGVGFRLDESRVEWHETPWGARQQFVYCYCTVAESTPLLEHALGEESAFTAAALVADVRAGRGVKHGALPEVCVLEFDGDLTDWLVAQGRARRVESWPCFHTAMYGVEVDGREFGVIARTIGGPYAVLVAEQLVAAGVRRIVGLTSAGRVSSDLPLPSLVVAEGAVRDEGTSLHYLPAGKVVWASQTLAEELSRQAAALDWRPVRRGLVWTTDAPYRETPTQLRHWAAEGVLAVEMQAASLFAFGQACGAEMGVVAMVSNAVDHDGPQFDTGTMEDGLRVLEACARAAFSTGL